MKGKPGAAQATEALRIIIQGKEVIIETVARESFNGSAAKVKVDRKSVNKAMKDKLKK